MPRITLREQQEINRLTDQSLKQTNLLVRHIDLSPAEAVTLDKLQCSLGQIKKLSILDEEQLELKLIV